ncbi:hypothetical protein [Mesorhizobium sp. M7A.F.Ca.US.014.04.1.1]|nr:hypothetical protein [Mesorhizobium sp. M7A.F.Ca.US.014.04.1.1]
MSYPSVDFERRFDDACALAGLARLGLPLETAGWRLGRGHHAGGCR